MKAIVSIIKDSVMFYCAIFTFGTLANSIGWLWFGLSTNPDVHQHIMIRAALCLALTEAFAFIKLVIHLFKLIKSKRMANKNP